MKLRACLIMILLCIALSAMAYQTIATDYLVSASGVTFRLPDSSTANLVAGPATTTNYEVNGNPPLTVLSKTIRCSGYINAIVGGENPAKEVIASGEGRFWRNPADKSIACTLFATLRSDRKIAISVMSGSKELLDTGLVTISSGSIFIRQLAPPAK